MADKKAQPGMTDPAPPEPRELLKLDCDRQLMVARFSVCGRMLIAGGLDASIRRWDLGGEKPVEADPVVGHHGWVSCLEVQPGGELVFSADTWGRLQATRGIAGNPEVAEAFVTFLLSPQGQQLIDRDTVLIPLAPPMEDLSPAAQLLARTTGSFLPIRLGPGLLTFLDEIKRAEFLRSWDATREQQYGP